MALSKPITITQIGTAIGSNSTKVSELCTSDSINKLSRYKPVENPNVVGEMTDAQFQEVNWGYSIPEMITQTDFRNYLVSGTIPTQWASPSSNARELQYGWYYIKPSTWFRMLDFNRYDHSTNGSLLGEMSCTTTTGTTFTVYYYAGIFSVADFGYTQGMHFGIAILTPDNILYFKTALDSGTIGQITLSVDEKSQVFNTNGTYQIFAIATTESVALTNQMTGFVVLPATTMAVSYQSGGSETDQYIYVRLDDVMNGSCTLYLENNGTSSYTLSGIYVGLYETDGEGNPTKRKLSYGPYSLTAIGGTTSSIMIDTSDYDLTDMEVGVKIYAPTTTDAQVKIDYSFHIYNT